MVGAGVPDAADQKILFVANANVASLQLSFLVPLALTPGEGRCALLTEHEIKTALGREADDAAGADHVAQRLDAFQPDLIVLCRYSGPQARTIVEWARARGVPTIFHIDDDLLDVPIELGAAKRALHMHPDRLEAIRYLLAQTSLVYCSTQALRRRLFGDEESQRVVVGEIYSALPVLRPAADPARRTVGYMGTDHRHDLAPVVPALVRLLDAKPDVTFEIFGATPMPEALKPFEDRIRTIPTAPDYGAFLDTLASLGWTIGICALAGTPFNAVKADNKWVEYTASGIAVVASRDTAYDRACADGCGLLADGEDAWLAAFERLLDDAAEHGAQVGRAQDKLRQAYDPDRLRAQIAEVFARARVLAGQAGPVEPEAEPPPIGQIALDELRGDRLWGWAWSANEAGRTAEERAPLELWCGSTRVGTVPRRIPRGDVDRHVEDAIGDKGFLAPFGALFALWKLFGESEAVEPVLRFDGASVPPARFGPWTADLAGFRTLRNAVAPASCDAADLWWANARLLKIRLGARAENSPDPAIASLRVLQPLALPDGSVRLAVADEQPVPTQGGIVPLGVHSPLMPIVLAGCDAQGHLVVVDLLPFPSLLRGGLHEAETAATGGQGGTFADMRGLNDAYLAEQAGLGAVATQHTVAEVAFDLREATGAELVFDPAVRHWLAAALGVPVTQTGAEARRAADLGDDTFTAFALDRFAEIRPAKPRSGQARLHLAGDALPTVGALVSRRRTASPALRPGPVVIADDAFPHRRHLLTFPDDRATGFYAAAGTGLDAIPHLRPIEGADIPDGATGPASDEGGPVALVFRDLDPAPDLARLYPVPKDVAEIPGPTHDAPPQSVSVLVAVEQPDLDLGAFLTSVADQRVAGGCEVLVGAVDHTGPQLDSLYRRLDASRPGQAQVFEIEAGRPGAILNQLAAEARGETLVVLDVRAVLHDERTLAMLARVSAMPGAGTVGCMLLRPHSKGSAATPVFRSAGLFPGRIDFALAPHLALAPLDCSAVLPDAIYPVAANSGLCWAVSASAWREAGGLSAGALPGAPPEIDLALRFALAGRINLCTTKLSVFVDDPAGPPAATDLGMQDHLGFWHLLPALRHSTVLRAF